MLNSPVAMNEEMGKSEEVRANQQSDLIRSNSRNIQRRQVAAFWLVFWFILALVSLFFWMIRLLGFLSFA